MVGPIVEEAAAVQTECFRTEFAADAACCVANSDVHVMIVVLVRNEAQIRVEKVRLTRV